MNKTMITEMYDKDSEGWYITLKRTEGDSYDNPFYTIEKENINDGRSRTSIQLNEEQFNILIRLIEEMPKVKE